MEIKFKKKRLLDKIIKIKKKFLKKWIKKNMLHIDNL